MNTIPVVSVLMPAFNAGPFLMTAVESILNQTFNDFELIIIDDGSTDESFAALDAIPDERIRLVRNTENLGLIASRNMAVNLARAPLLACLDADDVAMPRRLETQVQAFRADPDLALLGSSAYLIDDHGHPFDVIDVPTTNEEIRRVILRGNKIIHSSVMMRSSVVKSLDGYSTEYSLAEDYALWVRIIASHKVMNLSDRLIQYRVHRGQLSQTKIERMRAMAARIQSEAWKALQDTGRSAGVLPPPSQTLWSALRGHVGSRGRECLHWARIYRRMGSWPDTFKFLASGLLSAPLCAALYSVVLPPKGLPRDGWEREPKT
jgi:glycosyltransferase involved in cell wall biosynthesis